MDNSPLSNFLYHCQFQKGCEFCGTEKDVKEHMETCVNKISVEEQVGSLWLCILGKFNYWHLKGMLEYMS